MNINPKGPSHVGRAQQVVAIPVVEIRKVVLLKTPSAVNASIDRMNALRKTPAAGIFAAPAEGSHGGSLHDLAPAELASLLGQRLLHDTTSACGTLLRKLAELVDAKPVRSNMHHAARAIEQSRLIRAFSLASALRMPLADALEYIKADDHVRAVLGAQAMAVRDAMRSGRLNAAELSRLARVPTSIASSYARGCRAMAAAARGMSPALELAAVLNRLERLLPSALANMLPGQRANHLRNALAEEISHQPHHKPLPPQISALARIDHGRSR